MAVTHELKCWPEYFDAISRGEKKFDVRRDDRGFQKGDSVKMTKWDPKTQRALRDVWGNSPLTLTKRIRYILTGGHFGIEAGFVVLGF